MDPWTRVCVENQAQSILIGSPWGDSETDESDSLRLSSPVKTSGLQRIQVDAWGVLVLILTSFQWPIISSISKNCAFSKHQYSLKKNPQTFLLFKNLSTPSDFWFCYEILLDFTHFMLN